MAPSTIKLVEIIFTYDGKDQEIGRYFIKENTTKESFELFIRSIVGDDINILIKLSCCQFDENDDKLMEFLKPMGKFWFTNGKMD